MSRPPLPTHLMVAHTDPGMVRHLNEDAVFIAPEQGLAILADGMGGYNAGEVASAMAIETVKRELLEGLPKLAELPQDEALEALREDMAFAAERANNAIFTMAQRDPECEGMGTTLVIAVFTPGQITVGHVGDSRIYLLREGELTQVTRDHSWLQEQLSMGLLDERQASESRFKNIITRGLGIEPEVDIEVHSYPTQENDLFCLCSDGLSDMVQPEQMTTILSQSPPVLKEIAKQLIDAANENGGRDNISAILIHAARPPEGLVGKIGAWLRRS